MNRKLHSSEVNTTNNTVDFLVIENIKSQKWLASMKPIKILFLLKKQDETINETSIVWWDGSKCMWKSVTVQDLIPIHSLILAQ